MKEEIVELTGVDINDEGVLLLYSGDEKEITIPGEVKRIAPRAFSKSNIEKVFITAEIGVVEEESFYHCTFLREARLENGIVKISKNAFSKCPSLALVVIPDSVLIIDDGALPIGNKELFIIAKADSFAYKYAIEHKINVYECEDEYYTQKRKKEDLERRQNALEYKKFEIFGEKILVSNSLSFYHKIEEYYGKKLDQMLDDFYEIASNEEEKVEALLQKYIDEVVVRINNYGISVTNEEITKLIKEEITIVKSAHINYASNNQDKDIEKGFVENITLFVKKLETAEIKYLIKNSLAHENALDSFDKEMGMQISHNILSSGKCSEASVALSLKFYPYNPELIMYALRSGVVCDGLILLSQFLGIDIFEGWEDAIKNLLSRRDLFNKDVENLAKGTLDALLPEHIWGSLERCGAYPSIDNIDILKKCKTFDEIVNALINEIATKKAELDTEYEKAIQAYKNAKNAADLEAAVTLFARMNGYGDSKKKICEIRKKLQKRSFEIIKKISLLVVSLIAVALYITLIVKGIARNNIKSTFDFAENADGSYTIVAYKKNQTIVDIPETYRGEPVTAIGDNLFKSNSELISVKIPTSIKAIGNFSFFDCDSLTNVTIPNSVTSIGDSAFYSCDSLTSVTIGDSATSIGDLAFAYCTSLKSIIIPDSVTSIGSSTFSSCTSLESITIPDSVTSIGNWAFRDCRSLTTINYGGTEVQWGNITKGGLWDDHTGSYTIIYNYGTTDPSNFTFELVGNEYTITEYNGTYTKIVIPPEFNGKPVTSIGEEAFAHCKSLASVTIPDSVTSIGDYAFAGCDSLTSVTIPDSVTSIGLSAFANCTSLRYNEYDNTFYLGNENNPYVVLVKAKDKSITSCDINDNTRFIHSNAFYNCTSLTSITIPDSVTSIGGYAFSDCTSLTSVTIPDSVTSIGSSAFAYCTSLTAINYGGTEAQWGNITKGDYWDTGTGAYTVNYNYGSTSGGTVTVQSNITFELVGNEYKITGYNGSKTALVIPSKYNGKPVTSIGVSAFRGCTSLTSVTIPDSVTSIGNYAFYNCTNLTSINYSGTEVQWGNITKGTGWDYYTGSYTIIYNYESTSGGTVTEPSNLTFELVGNEYTITDYTGTDTEIVIPSKYNGRPVRSIGDYAFYNCTSLKSITIPDGVTSIGSFAFAYCTSLTTINYCSTSVQWGNITKGTGWDNSTGSYTIIYNYGSTGGGTATDPSSLTFELVGNEYKITGYNGSQTALVIPSEYNGKPVTSIGDYAFRDCTSLTSVTIPDSVTSIGNYAFYKCTSLTSITIPDSVTSIGGSAFSGCDSLKSVTIPNSATSIGNFAFYGCTRLTSVTIPDSVTIIGDRAFYNCTNLTTINYRGTEMQWGNITKGTSWDDYTGSYTVNYNYSDE